MREARQAARLPTTGPQGAGHRAMFQLWGVGAAGALLALAALVAALSGLWGAPGRVSAEDLPVAPAWRLGYLSHRGDASWWWAVVEDGRAPSVWADRGTLGVDYWSHCPAPEGQPQTCLVVAQGNWTVVTVDGAPLWQRGRAYLPVLYE